MLRRLLLTDTLVRNTTAGRLMEPGAGRAFPAALAQGRPAIDGRRCVGAQTS